MPKVTQPLTDTARIQTQVCLGPLSVLLHGAGWAQEADSQMRVA